MSFKEKFEWPEEPLFLIDGTSFLYRAFYAFPDLSRSDGFPTNAMYIVLRLLLRLKREESPTYCCFLLDAKGPTFRHSLFPDYKAQRLQMPESLDQQIAPLKKGVQLMGLTLLVGQEAEADDYIASLCQRFKKTRPVVIVGSDKDLLQCLDQQVILWDPSQRTEKVVTLSEFQAQEHLSPGQWPDYLALVGDKSDNIPGVPKVGPKTALRLLERFSSLDNLISNFDHLSRKDQEKLGPELDNLPLYRQLASLRQDLIQDQEIDHFVCQDPDFGELREFFQNYEFKSLLQEIQSWEGGPKQEDSLGKSFDNNSIVLDPSNLSDLREKEIGLVRVRDGFYIGLEDKEYFTELNNNPLVLCREDVQTFFVPSSKVLLEEEVLDEETALKKVFDLSLAAYLLNPEERNYKWERLQQAYGPETDIYQENQGQIALAIGQLLRNRLDKAELLNLMYQIEMPLIPVLVKMEKRGLGIDLEAFKSFLQEVEDKLAGLSRSIFEQAGVEFNLRSNQQLAEVLFHKLNLKSSRKTPGGMPSTASYVLEGIKDQHPIIEDLLQFRSLEKLRSTYLDPLPKMVDNKGRLHSHFNHLATATGRLSSSEPNLQNIPIRGEFGPRMRSCFVAAPGYKLVAADYSQIELRILAHMSQDSNLIEAFAQNEDIHTRTAGLLMDKNSGQVSPDDRRKAKTINFGLLYGMGPQKLARELNISLQLAKEFISTYFSRLEQVRKFYNEVEETARENGFVTTIAGRRRLLKDINSRNNNMVAQSIRMAINTVIQGSAADIIKLAMIRVESDPLLQKLKAGLILQVHDELILEVPEDQAYQAGERVEQIMTSVMDLEVPLTVEWGAGKNWAEAH